MNPFVVSGKIPDEYFCDRVEDSERLANWLINGHNIVLISPRRMGKTGLIYHVFEKPQIKKEYNCIFIDIFQTTSLREFTFLFGKVVFESLLPKGQKFVMKFLEALKSLTGKFSWDPSTGAPSFSIQIGDVSNPLYTLEEIFTFLEKAASPCIVAFDEFQQIANYPEKNVEAILRTHIQPLENCKFIYAGSRQHMMGEMFLYPSRPFYQSASIMHLDPIPLEIYADFAGEKFKECGKVLETETVEYVYEKFEGCTFYLQSVMNEVFSRVPNGAKGTTSLAQLAISEILEKGAGLYREILSGLQVRQKELLIAISKEGYADKITSGAFVKKYNLASPSSVQSALKKLMELNIVVRQNGKYTVSDKFMSLWINKIY